MVISVILLFFELLLDLVGLIAGGLVIHRSSDNKLQFTWGVLACTLSGLLLFDNLEWFYLLRQGDDTIRPFMPIPMEHLSIWHIFRVILFFQFYSLLPIASLKPGWLTFPRIVTFYVPALFISCIIVCYESFNGYNTTLKSFDEILANMDKQDVALRFFLFVFSVIAPTCNFLFPYLNKWIPFHRKQSKAMLFYIISYAMIMSAYLWLMLGTSGISFNLFGLVVIVPVMYLNILYLRDENPLAEPPCPVEELQADEREAMKEVEVSPAVLELCDQLQRLMKENVPFTVTGYSLPDLLQELGTSEYKLNKAFRYRGFTGFKDYINFCRLQYFKELAAMNKDRTVKELMFMCGFTSRSTFYRLFSNLEKMSPSEYIEMLNKDENAV